MKKTILASSTIVALGVIGMVGAGSVSAATDTSSSGQYGIIQRLAERFQLSSSDVQQVFDEQRAENQAEHQQAMRDRLTEAVTEGKLTQEQADLIKEKSEEMKSFRESLGGMTHDERRIAMEQHRSELKQWAKENNIPVDLMWLGGPHGGHDRGFGLNHHHYTN